MILQTMILITAHFTYVWSYHVAERSIYFKVLTHSMDFLYCMERFSFLFFCPVDLRLKTDLRQKDNMDFMECFPHTYLWKLLL